VHLGGEGQIERVEIPVERPQVKTRLVTRRPLVFRSSGESEE